MLGNSGIYANKKRKKPVLKQKKISDGNAVVKSNPSKRHRDRLNGELDRLMDLLPFDEDVRSRLDKLSVLRLSVGYLRVKSFFKATVKTNHSSLAFTGQNGNNGNNINNINNVNIVNNVNHVDNGTFSEGDLLLQALNGFVIVVTAEGLVFYSSPTIKDYLGFHQSDVVHQSVFELIHTDDRSTFREQLHFALNPSQPADGDGVQVCGNPVSYNPEQLPPENSSFLERSFVCRFRCLLDNSSGFLALKFQGRLKFLHGQNLLRDNGGRSRPQLALFAIAMPVQTPSIVEIRTKMMLFQTKHKMDFTPLGTCSRGRVILGYSEAELCSKGSGYQFIHAADMMYCADNHIRMMKTGESGLTVFRLLTKSEGWMWVKSNAKVIFKGGRPDFIIAYQQALVKSEGEEYFRQRRLELPFSDTTGEAVLYNTGPTMDISQAQFNRKFGSSHVKKDEEPKSLLDCLMRQDENVYSLGVTDPLPVDQMFLDSQVLLKVTNDPASDNTVVKKEAQQSVMAVINSLEKMVHSGDFTPNPDMGGDELMEWENALKRLGQGDNPNNVKSDLDSLLTEEIFDFVDSVLFKENSENLLDPTSCLNGLNQQQEPFSQFSAGEHQEPPLFPTPSPEQTFPPMNGVYAQQQNRVNGGGIPGSNLQSAQVFGNTQALTHQGPLIPQIPQNPQIPQIPQIPQVPQVPQIPQIPQIPQNPQIPQVPQIPQIPQIPQNPQIPQIPQVPQVPRVPPTNSNLSPLQQLQLQDIFSPSIELPALTVPNISADDAFATFQSCGQASLQQSGCHRGVNGVVQQADQLLLRQNRPAAMLQSSVLQPNSVAPALMDTLPPLIPCTNFNSSSSSNISFSSPCLQGNLPIDPPSRPLQQWNQNQNQKVPHAGIVQNGHEALPGFQSQNPQSQTIPHAGFWPRGVTGLNQQGALPGGQASNHSSCMFNQHFSSSPPGRDVLASSGTPVLRGANPSLDQSPVQASCYYQQNHSEPVVSQENASISALTAQPNMSVAQYARIQHYLQNNRQTQQTNDSGMFVAPPLDVSTYLME